MQIVITIIPSQRLFFDETPDSYYTTRYFAVLFEEDETVSQIKTSHIAYIDEEQAEKYARIALDRPFHFGNFGRYYYYNADREEGGTIVIYLDRTEQLSLMRRVLISVLSIRHRAHGNGEHGKTETVHHQCQP